MFWNPTEIHKCAYCLGYKTDLLTWRDENYICIKCGERNYRLTKFDEVVNYCRKITDELSRRAYHEIMEAEND